MSTEAPEAPAQSTNEHAALAAAFDAALARANQPDQPAESPAPAEKPAAPAPVADAKAEEPAFPEQILTGEKPAAKPEEPKLDPENPLSAPSPKGLREEAKVNWEKLRKAGINAAVERDNLRRELEQLKAQAPKHDDKALEELKTYQQKLAEMEQTLERTSFEKSPKFQAFVDAEKANIESAKTYLEGTEIDPSIIDRAASVTGAKRLEVLKTAGLDSETIAAIAPYLANVDQLGRQKADALANHKQTAAQWEAQQKAQEEQRRALERAEDERIYKTVGLDVASKFEPFQKVEGHDKWNAQVDALAAEAKEFFSGNMPVEKLAEIAYYGVGAKVIHQMFHSQRAQLKAAREEIAALKAGQPGGGESPNTTPDVSKMSDDERRAMEFNRALNQR